MQNHQRQLTSPWLNTMAAGLVSGGVVTQLVAIAAGASLRIGITIMVLCVASGCTLHALALRLSRDVATGDEPGW